MALPDTPVGREREIELLLAALDSGAHVVLEGPPGTGKSTVLRAVASDQDVPFLFVEGNAELTPARLVGHFDPARVLADGYVEEIFVDGPLVAALRTGGLFYVEELNRVPEETLNVLITVMSEGELHVPRLGKVEAAKGFRLVAAMNPFDAVGTARISAAVYDRTCRIAMGYQSAADEALDRVAAGAPAVPDEWRAKVVELTRRTRAHPDVRIGSSVRGSIDLTRLATSLAGARGTDPTDWHVGLDAALVALSGRIRLQESAGRPAEDVVRELYEQVFGPPPSTTTTGAKRAVTRRGKQQPARSGQPGSASAAVALAHRLARRPEPAPRAVRRGLAAIRRTRRDRPRSGLARRSPDQEWNCWPTSPSPPTRGCARRRAGWPPGCCSTSHGPDGRGAAAPHGCAACRPTSAAIWTSTCRSTASPVHAPRAARPGSTNSWRGTGDGRTSRCACSWTRPGR